MISDKEMIKRCGRASKALDEVIKLFQEMGLEERITMPTQVKKQLDEAILFYFGEDTKPIELCAFEKQGTYKS